MSDILKHNTENTTKKASEIEPNKKKKPVTFDDVLEVIEGYFSSQSRDQNKFFRDGKVHLIREEFNIVPFISTIHQMAESCIKTEVVVNDQDAKQISEIFKAMNSLTQLLKNQFNTQDVEYLFIVRLLSYCTYSYIKYHKSYARSRKVQKEKDNVKG